MREQPRFTADTEFVETDLDIEPVTLPDGTVLDEAGAEQHAQQVIAEARRLNLKPGGKSLSGGSKHSPVVRVVLPEPLRDKLKERAEREGVSVSKLARELLARELSDTRRTERRVTKRSA